MAKTWKVKALTTERDKTLRKNFLEETKMAKTWKVKALTAEKPGKLVWRTIKEFDSPAKADNWLCSYIKKNGYRIDDFNIVRA